MAAVSGGGNPHVQGMPGANQGAMSYRQSRMLDTAIANILSGSWAGSEIKAYLAPSYADKIKVSQHGGELYVTCACGRRRAMPMLSAIACPQPTCGLLFVSTHRRCLVSWALDSETEEKMAVLRRGFLGPLGRNARMRISP